MHKGLRKLLDLPAMETLFLFLEQIYDDVLVGAPLAKDSRECATLLTPHFSPKDLSTKDTESLQLPPKSSTQNFSASGSAVFGVNEKCEASEHEGCSQYCAKEIVLLQLTLIKMILSNAQSRELALGIKQKYLDIIRILLKDKSIDAKLIDLLCNSDKQLSYMASKTLVSLILFQLTEEVSHRRFFSLRLPPYLQSLLNSAWLAFSSETLLGFPCSSWLAPCFWALTDTIRETLKDEGLCKKGILEAVLGPLDKVLEGLYNSAVSYYSDLPQDVAISPKVTNDLSGFLDLLELLVASRIQVPLSCSCQRMVFLNASGVLGLSTAPVHDLVKKKSVVLLKQCLLQKAGEDVKRKVPSASNLDPRLDADRLVLAGDVLRFVRSGWLGRLSVSGKTSHFGGREVKPEVDLCCGSDQVTLRALSLVLLKALEIKIQESSSEADIQVQLESAMSPLLRFLSRYLKFPPHAHLFEHPCSWVSVLFIEQDDDLLEAAKALLTIHLKLQRFQCEAGVTSRRGDGVAQGTLLHRSGCNAHCIFLFLLKSIAFDATVLLDFLISSETCFLEYFVRYLKLLAEDWHQFVAVSECSEPGTGGNACPLNSGWNRIPPDPQSRTVVVPLNPSQKFSPPQQVLKPKWSDPLPAGDDASLPESLQRLVDYESSEESEPEGAGEDRWGGTDPSPSDNRICSDEARRQETAGTAEQATLAVSSPSLCRTSPNNSGSVLHESMACFRKLQVLISRLHGRNLFPYNPGPLLKLLARVNATSKCQVPMAKTL